MIKTIHQSWVQILDQYARLQISLEMILFVFGNYIYKALITIKVFEDTNKNPIGIYMLDEIKIPDGHDKRGYRLLSDRNCKYND